MRPSVLVLLPLAACGGMVPVENGERDASDEAETATPAVDASANLQSASCADGGLGIIFDPTVDRLLPGGQTAYPFRPANEDPSAIDVQDCDADIQLQFLMRLCGLPTTDTIQVWAGLTDCTNESARSGTDGPFCWRVAPDVATSQTTSSTIDVRQVTQYVDAMLSAVPNGGTAPQSGLSPGASACESVGPFTSSCVATPTIFFVAVQSDGVTADTAASYSLPVFLSACSAEGDSGS